eukprot:363986-Chlamydomonas_euryale.AAC.16
MWDVWGCGRERGQGGAGGKSGSGGGGGRGKGCVWHPAPARPEAALVRERTSATCIWDVWGWDTSATTRRSARGCALHRAFRATPLLPPAAAHRAPRPRLRAALEAVPHNMPPAAPLLLLPLGDAPCGAAQILRCA